jgi:hypothetical protein
MLTHGAAPVQEEEMLVEKAGLVTDERRDAGLEGLVGGLDSVIITTATTHLAPAVYELLRYTGLTCTGSFVEGDRQAYVLSLPGSASLVVRSRGTGANPFLPVNRARLTVSIPDTRLETFVFAATDLAEYVQIQRGRGIRFLTPEIQDADAFRFIQTTPSPFTGNSVGFIEWKGTRSYTPAGARPVPPDLKKPPHHYLEQIGGLDHAATRVRAQDRMPAILEFLNLTSYRYDFGVYVRSLNSITSVARRERDDFAMVFTSGIRPYTNDADSGPTEMFIADYGTRVHHMAFRTEHIERTVAALGRDGMEFLLDLVGSEEEGLQQIFSVPSQHTLLVTEYIRRFGGFDGFFTRSNVERLTAATVRR